MAAASIAKTLRLYAKNSLSIRVISTTQVHLSGNKILPFDDERVKSILKRMTGCDVQKVFSNRQQRHGVGVPTYKLMTDEELLQEEKNTKLRAETILEMPPVMEERKEIDEVLDIDERLLGYDSVDYVFTDISPNINDKKRKVVVREPSGRLRSASWEERDHVNFIYFPKDGRKWEMPEMLTESGIQVPLSQNRHEDVLDLICVQCEPDTKDYIRVHETVYEDVNQNSKHDLLWSTCHFGGLVYYLMKHRKLDNVIEYFTDREMFDEAVDVITLHHLVYPDHITAKEAKSSKLTGIQVLRAYLKRAGPISSLQTVEETFFNKKQTKKSST